MRPGAGPTGSRVWVIQATGDPDREPANPALRCPGRHPADAAGVTEAVDDREAAEAPGADEFGEAGAGDGGVFAEELQRRGQGEVKL